MYFNLLGVMAQKFTAVSFDGPAYTPRYSMADVFTTADRERPAHTLKSSVLKDIGIWLSATSLDADSHDLRAQFGCSVLQYNKFILQNPTNPEYEMLKHWATNNDNTVGILMNKLQELDHNYVISHEANSMTGK